METAVTEQVVTYLSRLTGDPLTADTPLRLRSVQRAAFSSWARQQQVPIRLAVISSSVPFSVLDLLSAETGLVTTKETGLVTTKELPTSPKESAVSLTEASAVGAVGIDLEDIENLPAAHDYREHPFYQDNFTAAEISFCIRQPNVRASLCGTWAAKEAVLKAGVMHAPLGNLKGIEISRDELGRPTYPGCSLSISHTARSAVAICTATFSSAKAAAPLSN